MYSNLSTWKRVQENNIKRHPDVLLDHLADKNKLRLCVNNIIVVGFEYRANFCTCVHCITSTSRYLMQNVSKYKACSVNLSHCFFFFFFARVINQFQQWASKDPDLTFTSCKPNILDTQHISDPEAQTYLL